MNRFPYKIVKYKYSEGYGFSFFIFVQHMHVNYWGRDMEKGFQKRMKDEISGKMHMSASNCSYV